MHGQVFLTIVEALPGVLGIQGEGLFIFRDLGRRVINFEGFGEKAVLGSREQGVDEKHYRKLGRKVIFLFTREQGAKTTPPRGGGIIIHNFL